MILSVGGTPVTYAGKRLSLPMPRITVHGKNLMRSGQPFKVFGVQPLFGDWLREYFLTGGESERADIVAFLAGAKACNSNVFRLHMELWDFIEGDDIPSLAILPTPFANLMYFLKIARKNGIYVLLAGNNFWHTSTIPAWFDLRSNADRWTVSEFYFASLASAILEAGHSSTILGYELISEPIISSNPAAEWYQGQFPGTDLYFIPCIARGVATIDQPDAVRDWVTQLATAIRANDPRANVTIGVLPFITGSFGPDNTGDLLDFFSPHIYPPNFLLNPVTLAQAIGYAEDWAETSMPVVIGESSNWSTVDSENVAFLDAVMPIVEGYITFYWGYPPWQYTIPPDAPRYPATSDDVDANAYTFGAEALRLSMNYSNDFLYVPWFEDKETIAAACIGDSNAFASGGFTPPGGQTANASVYCRASSAGQTPYSEDNLGWYALDPNGTARTDEYNSYIATVGNIGFVGQMLNGNGNSAMQMCDTLQQGSDADPDVYLYQAAAGGTTADFWANDDGWDTLERTIPAALSEIPGSPTYFNVILLSLGGNDCNQDYTAEQFYTHMRTLRRKMVDAGWWNPGVTRVLLLDLPRNGNISGDGGTYPATWLGIQYVLDRFNDPIALISSVDSDFADDGLGVHYTPPSYTAMGAAAGESLLGIEQPRAWAA